RAITSSRPSEWYRRLSHLRARGLPETGLGGFLPYNNTDYYRRVARENASFFNKKFVELQGSTALLQKILDGPYTKDAFVILGPDEISTQNHFIK
ncbi:MAG: hypothetical protein R6U19_04880, partial [Bacteroidales bacterium]